MSVYAGIDVHRKRSRVAVIDEGGKVLASRDVPSGVKPVLSVIGELPAGTPAAYEAAFGWGWLLELPEDCGFDPHMVHPLQCKAIASARLKNDEAGAATLAQLLRADLLPEAWIAPPEVRSGTTARPGRAGKGNPYLRGALGQSVMAAARTDTRLGEQYRRIARRRGKQKAIVAVSQVICEISAILIADPAARFTDPGADYYSRASPTR